MEKVNFSICKRKRGENMANRRITKPVIGAFFAVLALCAALSVFIEYSRRGAGRRPDALYREHHQRASL